MFFMQSSGCLLVKVGRTLSRDSYKCPLCSSIERCPISSVWLLIGLCLL